MPRSGSIQVQQAKPLPPLKELKEYQSEFSFLWYDRFVTSEYFMQVYDNKHPWSIKKYMILCYTWPEISINKNDYF